MKWSECLLDIFVDVCYRNEHMHKMRRGKDVAEV
jgi:hypothetical protein